MSWYEFANYLFVVSLFCWVVLVIVGMFSDDGGERGSGW